MRSFPRLHDLASDAAHPLTACQIGVEGPHPCPPDEVHGAQKALREHCREYTKPLFCQKHMFCIPVQVCLYLFGAVHSLTDGGWRLTDGGWRLTDNCWPMTNRIHSRLFAKVPVYVQL